MSSTSAAALTEKDLAGIDELCDSFTLEAGVPVTSNLIPALQALQDRYGWLPEPALYRLSERFKIPMSSVYGVVTFYSQFYLEPRGKHTVKVCRGTACHVRGASKVLATIEQVLGVGDGETTPDLEFTIETVACLGTCFLAPVMMIDENYYGKLDPGKVRKVFEQFDGKKSGKKKSSSKSSEKKDAGKKKPPKKSKKKK